LTIFAEHRINLTKIQSIPVIGKPNEYSFHIDVEYDTMEDYERAIHQVLKNVSSLAILGEYKKGDIDLHK
jgi:Prephenate dehydratase